MLYDPNACNTFTNRKWTLIYFCTVYLSSVFNIRLLTILASNFIIICITIFHVMEWQRLNRKLQRSIRSALTTINDEWKKKWKDLDFIRILHSIFHCIPVQRVIDYCEIRLTSNRLLFRSYEYYLLSTSSFMQNTENHLSDRINFIEWENEFYLAGESYTIHHHTLYEMKSE